MRGELLHVVIDPHKCGFFFFFGFVFLVAKRIRIMSCYDSIDGCIGA